MVATAIACSGGSAAGLALGRGRRGGRGCEPAGMGAMISIERIIAAYGDEDARK
jgi:hypothetical protein